MKTLNIIRLQITVNGIVQGVGFRPFIFKLAHEHELTGYVKNTPDGVEIEVEGEETNAEKFFDNIKLKAPPLSEIIELTKKEIAPAGSESFEIQHSPNVSANQTVISPDICICDDCLNELFDHQNRRYLYPFINCTNCGPRYTIIENVPYDRKYTTMQNFKMCEDCQKEYDDPLDRRFHAQSNACEKCGPKTWFEFSDSTEIIKGNESIKKTAELLLQGKIIAIKGLGGFHIAADALNETAVETLRERKGRELKPFAIMVKDLDTAKRLVEISTKEEQRLISPQRPILLLRKRKNILVADSVAPKNNRLGIMLPYTPLHYLIFYYMEQHFHNGNSPVLVMTSANYSEEPIEITNDGAKERLAKLVDGYLVHNRDILIRSDDSVMIFINNKQRIIRRSRGFVPKPFYLQDNGPAILALGAELKNTICLLKNKKAFISQHIGDLTNYSAYEFFQQSIRHFQLIMDCKPEYVAHDLHPDYLSTRWAKEKSSLHLIGVQHHHAHMASCMAEHNLHEPVIGIILDGTGFGYDRTIWGGEILIGNYTNFKRYAYLEQIPLPGGDAAVKEPWKIGVSYLYHAFDKKLPDIPFLKLHQFETIIQMIEKNFNSPLTSSTGRLFDAVSVISGGPPKIYYEAQAAIELTQAVNNLDVDLYNYDLKDGQNRNVIPLKTFIRSITEDVQAKVPFEKISAKFHKTLAEIFSGVVLKAQKETGIQDVVLSGGVFQNEILLKLMEDKLCNLGFNVFSHSKIPTNDGGISIGQAVIARELITKNIIEAKVEY